MIENVHHIKTDILTQFLPNTPVFSYSQDAKNVKYMVVFYTYNILACLASCADPKVQRTPLEVPLERHPFRKR